MLPAVQEHRVALDRTAFYPTGGGQPCDHGSLSTDSQQWAVVNVRKDGEEVWHEVEGEPPAVGTEVTGALAWDRRYALMRTHTALHMLAGVIWRNYGAQVTAATWSRCVPAWISSSKACIENSSRRSNRK